MGKAELEYRRAKPQGIPIEEITRTKDYIGQNGRPLLELHARDTVVAQQRLKGIVFDLRPHHHRDSRRLFPDQPMNMSAMHEVITGLKPLKDDMAWINDKFFGGAPTEDILAGDAGEMAGAGLWLPAYLVLRAENPIDREAIPDHVANLSKASQGLYASINKFTDENVADTNITPEVIYTTANTQLGPEKRSYLVGSKEVCPASQPTIEDVASALLYQTGGDPNQSGLESLFAPGEFSSLHAFSLEAQEFLLFNMRNTQRINRIIDEAKKLLFMGVPPEDPRIIVARQTVDTLAESAQNAKNQAQAKINLHLGRDPLNIPGA